jgi:DNA polymerase III alpha subunit
MKQKTLNGWLGVSKPHITPLTQSTEANAREALVPLFLRSIPMGERYARQLEEEFRLIDKNNFTKVFLQVRTILQLIESIGQESGEPIPHIIRGSAGSSLVCYLLGITHIDPLLHGIQLARFMNQGRTDLPDIDIDVPYNRREEIYGRIAVTWPGAVARISNYNTWSTKTALRETIKELLKTSGREIPRALLRKGYKAESILPEKTEREAAVAAAKEKVGTLRGYSKHCGGIVIFDQEGKVPEELVLKELESAGKPLVQIKLNKDDTEAAGYLKIDLLSNRGLAQLAQICPDRSLTDYPVRDPATERIFEKGWNFGITFGESRGMRKLFMDMRPRNVNEIAVALALIRPAAAAEGRKQCFLDKWRRSKPSSNALDRPIIFDDDAITKIQALLGCSSAEADKWRKAFAKGNALARLDFRRAAYELGHSQDTVDSVVDDLNQLIYYSFCKSHAVSYAQLVWALAYWKAHRPHEFWAAALNHCQSEFRKWVHYREARCSGLLLSRGPPPYKVTLGESRLVSEKGEQTLLAPLTPVEDYRRLGYWCAEEFLPGCGVWPAAQKRLDGKESVRFRGLIASGRTVTRDWGSCTLVCMGVGNREYVDLILPDQKRSDLMRWAVLEGVGVRSSHAGRAESIEVEKIHGVSLGKMSSRD